MRRSDEQTSHMFSFVVPEHRVRQDRPLRGDPADDRRGVGYSSDGLDQSVGSLELANLVVRQVEGFAGVLDVQGVDRVLRGRAPENQASPGMLDRGVG
jgi:hypothetical protein